MFGSFGSQIVGQGCFKNGKKDSFSTSDLTPNSVFPKNKVLKCHSPNTQGKLKNKLTGLHKTLQKFIILLKLIAR